MRLYRDGRGDVLLVNVLRFIEPPLLGTLRNQIEYHCPDEPDAVEAVRIINEYAMSYDENDRQEFERGG